LWYVLAKKIAISSPLSLIHTHRQFMTNNQPVDEVIKDFSTDLMEGGGCSCLPALLNSKIAIPIPNSPAAL
jgi:hypothetical protein